MLLGNRGCRREYFADLSDDQPQLAYDPLGRSCLAWFLILHGDQLTGHLAAEASKGSINSILIFPVLFARAMSLVRHGQTIPLC